MAMENSLSDGIVFLRKITAKDVERHLAAEDEPTVRFLSGGRSTAKSVLAWAKTAEQSWNSSGPKRSFGIALSKEGELIGMVDFNVEAPKLHVGVANISYGIYPDARGNGYATRAVELVTNYIRYQTNINIVVIGAHTENVKSQRVAERLGFLRLGIHLVGDSGDELEIYAKTLRKHKELSLSDIYSR